MFEAFARPQHADRRLHRSRARAGHDLVPLLWCSAAPSAHVTEDAYERIAGMMLDRPAQSAGPFDAIYLDLHGAMVAEHLEDGEGELLRRVRAAVGADLPIVASLDFHANVTETMARMATALRRLSHLSASSTWPRPARARRRCSTGG